MIKAFFWSLFYVTRWAKPRVMLRLLWNYLGLMFLGKKPIRGIDFAITYDCFLKCSHCNISRMKSTEKSELTLEEYIDVVRQIREMGAVSITFTGGEPLISPMFEKILKAIDVKDWVIIVQTSGILLTDERLARLRDLGVDILNVSLDSFYPKEHDQNRGIEGTFERTMAAISKIRSYNMQPMIGTVVSHQNVHGEEFLKLIEFTYKNRILLLLNLAVPIGRWEGNLEVILTPEDRRHLESLQRKWSNIRVDFQSNYRVYGCPGGKEKFYMTAYGDIQPCTFFQFSFGNVRDLPLKEIQKKILASEHIGLYHRLCPVAENKDFIEKDLSKTFGSRQLPVPFDKLS